MANARKALFYGHHQMNHYLYGVLILMKKHLILRWNVLSGNKYWDNLGDIDGIRPRSVTVHLLGNGKEVAVYTLSEGNAWHWSGFFR